MAKKDVEATPEVVVLEDGKMTFDAASAAILTSDEYTDAKFVSSGVQKVVVIPTDHPERLELDGVYIVKEREQGGVTLVQVGRFTGRIPKVIEVNDFNQPLYQKVEAQAKARAAAK